MSKILKKTASTQDTIENAFEGLEDFFTSLNPENIDSSTSAIRDINSESPPLADGSLIIKSLQENECVFRNDLNNCVYLRCELYKGIFKIHIRKFLIIESDVKPTFNGVAMDLHSWCGKHQRTLSPPPPPGRTPIIILLGCVKVAISDQNKSFERELDMLVVKKITDFIPQKALEIKSDFFNFVELADSKFNVPGKIDLLLGANIFYELLKPERIKIKDSQLLLVNSVFGYIVTGNLDSINETKVHCGLIRDDLNKTLEKFWKVEEVEEPIVKNKERLICEEHYANTHFRTKEGKYVVSMPLKKEPSCLGNSKDIALKRLGSLWNRLARDENYLNLYPEFLRDYERLGHMKEVTNETEPKITY
ncbi:uncharacterized protein TNCV_3263891 [Trichonephila clavipes]|nr:uncharacterized protein TNCV_3263891 [Trichonephila clavipes]